MHERAAAGDDTQPGARGRLVDDVVVAGLVHGQRAGCQEPGSVGEPGARPHGLGEQGLDGYLAVWQQQHQTAWQAGQVRRLWTLAFNVGHVRDVAALGRPPACQGDQLAEIAVPVAVLGQHDDPDEGRACCGAQQHFAADDEVQSAFAGFQVGAHHARERAFVGQRQSGVHLGGGPAHQGLRL